MSTLTDVVTDALNRHRFRWASEVDLHAGLEQVFADAGLTVRREVTLADAGRIDFLLADPLREHMLGVEVKVAGSVPVVARQLLGYARHVDDLMLITTRAQHLTLRGMTLPTSDVVETRSFGLDDPVRRDERVVPLHVHHLRGGGL